MNYEEEEELQPEFYSDEDAERYAEEEREALEAYRAEIALTPEEEAQRKEEQDQFMRDLVNERNESASLLVQRLTDPETIDPRSFRFNGNHRFGTLLESYCREWLLDPEVEEEAAILALPDGDLIHAVNGSDYESNLYYKFCQIIKRLAVYIQNSFGKLAMEGEGQSGEYKVKIPSKLKLFTGNYAQTDYRINHQGEMTVVCQYINGEIYFLAHFDFPETFTDRALPLAPYLVEQSEKSECLELYLHPKSRNILHLNQQMTRYLEKNYNDSQPLEPNDARNVAIEEFRNFSCYHFRGDTHSTWDRFLGEEDPTAIPKNKYELSISDPHDENRQISFDFQYIFSAGKLCARIVISYIHDLVPDILQGENPLDDLEAQLDPRDKAAFLCEAGGESLLYLSPKLEERIEDFMDLTQSFTLDEVKESLLQWTKNGSARFQEVMARNNRVLWDMNDWSLFAGRAYTMHPLTGGEPLRLANLQIYIADIDEKTYFYVEWLTPSPFANFQTHRHDYSAHQDQLEQILKKSTGELCVLVDVEHCEVVAYDQAVAKRIELIQESCFDGRTTGELSASQFVQDWVFTASTSDREAAYETPAQGYDRLHALTQTNPTLSISVDAFYGNRYVRPDGEGTNFTKFMNHADLRVIEEKILFGTFGCYAGQVPHATFTRFQLGDRVMAEIAVRMVPVFAPLRNSTDYPTGDLKAALQALWEKEDAPCLVAEIQNGMIIDQSPRLDDIFDAYFEHHNSRALPSTSYLGHFEKAIGYHYYQVYREFIGTEHYNPLSCWNKQDPFTYPIYDLGIDTLEEKYRSNIFGLSVEVSVEPIPLFGTVYALVRFIPLPIEKPAPLTQSVCQGMTNLNSFLQDAEKKRNKERLCARTSRRELLKLLQDYYQADHVTIATLAPDNKDCATYSSVSNVFEFSDSLFEGLREWSASSTLRPHYVAGGTIPEENILYDYHFFDLHNSQQVAEIHQTLAGRSNSICATPMGKLFDTLQSRIPFHLHSLGVAICRDHKFSTQNALLVLNPKYHTQDDKGQVELMNLVSRIDLIQTFVDQFGNQKENQPALVTLWDHLNYEINQETRRLNEEYGSGYMSRYPIGELVPYWQTQKPRQMGVIYTPLAETLVIPVYLTAMTMDENGEPVPLEVRRYSGTLPLIACFGWSKKEFEDLVKHIENIHAETTALSEEIVGHAWGSGYYWIEKLMENARLLQFIKKQKRYALCSWEGVENQHLARLLHDIKRSQYYVVLQPQVSLTDDDWTCHGAEALVRRRGTALSPDVFVPLFEEQGIVRHVDFFVLDTVCYHIAKWRREDGKSIRIAVNLSRITLMEADIVESIRAVVDHHQVPHELVMMEVTEREGLIKSEVSQALVKEFREHGFMVSLDDFGSDSSNLGALSKMSVDEVKVDKSLVDHIGLASQHEHANKVSSMVRNIAKMCQEFDYKTITLAEGIESQEQADALKDYAYDLGQGFLFDKPLEIEAFYHKYIRNAKK